MSEPLLGGGPTGTLALKTPRPSGPESPSDASPCHSDPTPRFWPLACLWFREMPGIRGDFVVSHPRGPERGGASPGPP